MFGGGAARARRFSLLLLEEEEDYVQDWVVLAAWPVDRVAGNWQRSPLLQGRLRLCTRSLFFEPDDVRVPIARIPLAAVKSLGSGPPVASVAAAAASGAGAAGASRPPTAAAAGGGPSLVLESREVALMRANLEEVPYTFLRAPGGEGPGAGFRWAFGPCFSPLGPLLAQAGALREINGRPREERNAALEDLARQRLDGVSFDCSRLQDFGERLVWCGPVLALTPLVREWGHLAITPARVYFQPLHNIAGGAPVKSHPLAAIAAVARRRSSLRPVGLELFFLHPDADTRGPRRSGGRSPQHTGSHAPQLAAVAAGPLWDAPSAFFAFRTEADREAARHLLTCQPELGACVPRLLPPAAGLGPAAGAASSAASAQAQGLGGGAGGTDPLAAHGMLLEAAGPWLRRVTAAWQRGAISNFDYLLYLNFAAGRSFNDLAQWPVFPWVLKNYVTSALDLDDPANYRDLAKPVGALNPARLDEFRRRYREMPADAFEGSVPPFLYGTHYSTPGYVMYWLVRAAPSHMLRLQNGRFDAPDRLFASVQEAWEGVLSSSTDVKELIPEFFMPAWDFLINARHLPLGARQNGRPVGDVELPPWATDPRDFLAKQRAALESPPVSRQLHAWIDLIFGYKQQGPAAEAADNVFYHLTYEGAVNRAAITSPLELKALETQINEFGQTPKQLFTTPHPPRLVCPPAPDPATVFPGEDAAPSPAGIGGAAFAAAAGGTGYAGEGDAGNRDLALALLSTIIAAASAPEAEAEAGRTSDTGAAPSPQAAAAGSAQVGQVTAASGVGGAASGASPSPSPQPPAGRVESPPPPHGISAASPVAASPAAAGASSATSLFSSFLKLGRYQQQQQHPQGDAAAGLTTAASGPAAAGPLSHWSSIVGALTGNGARRAGSPAEGAAPSVGSGSGGGAAHLSGAHSEPALSAMAAGAATASPGVSYTPAVTTGATGTAVPVAAGTAHTGGSSHTGAAAGGVGEAAGGGGGAGGGVAAAAGALLADWGWGSRCGRPFRCVAASQLTRGSLAAVASGRNGYLYCVGQAGIRVVAEGAGAQVPAAAADEGAGGGGAVTAAADGIDPGGALTVVRSAQLEGELLSLVMLPLRSPSAAAAPAAGNGAGAVGGAAPGGGARHGRLMVAGSHRGAVVAYSPDAGRVVGSFEAHDDAVCCLGLLGAATAGPALVASSWDCSVKIWSLAEGREPWSSGLGLATAELRDFDSGVWALAADPWVGALLATGTEEGVVALWDTRAPGRRTSCAWQAHVAHDYVGGLALISDHTTAAPGGGDGGGGGGVPGTAVAGCAPAMLLAATADGALTLFDLRATGGAGRVQRLASAVCGAPLRCCAADARAALAGDESGAVQLWDVGRMAGGTEAVRAGGPGPDGLYPPWEGEATGGAAVCGLDVYPGANAESEGGKGVGGSASVRVAVVTEGGKLAVLEG